jgi:NAD+ kinase
MITYSTIGIIHHGLLREARTLASEIARRHGGKAAWTATQDTLEQQSARLDSTDLIVTIGGDGTILRGVHVAAPRGIPVLGVNMGRVGFMSEIDAAEALERIPWYLAGNARTEERTMLRAQPSSGEGPFDALNEVTIARGEVLRVIEIETRINGQLLSVYRGDGVVVATATGSTGYTLSLGGPVLDPTSDHIYVKPIASHMSQFGGVVLRPDSSLSLRLISEIPAVLSSDGFINSRLLDGQTVSIGPSPYRARFLRSQPPVHFWATLSRRLGMRQGALPRRARSDSDSDTMDAH